MKKIYTPEELIELDLPGFASLEGDTDEEGVLNAQDE